MNDWSIKTFNGSRIMAFKMVVGDHAKAIECWELNCVSFKGYN